MMNVNKYIIILGVILHLIFSALLGFIINIFIEEFSDNENKGRIRGVFLTLFNTGILISPLIAGQILNVTKYNFKIVYLISAVFLIPMILLIREYYKNISDPVFRKINILGSIKSILKNKDVSGIMLAMLLLESFYSLMIIYMPIYIITYTNLNLSEYVGVILPFALIPFVLIPYETGILADQKIGEKELLFSGFFILILSIIIIFNSTNSNLVFWSLVLALSRVGASLIETMVFTYFFKKVKTTEISTITIFSNLRTISYVITGLLSGLIMYFTSDIKIIFYIFITIIIISLFKIYKIKDTL